MRRSEQLKSPDVDTVVVRRSRVRTWLCRGPDQLTPGEVKKAPLDSRWERLFKHSIPQDIFSPSHFASSPSVSGMSTRRMSESFHREEKASTSSSEVKMWLRDGFVVTTDRSMVSIPALSQAFAMESMYWAKALPEDAMKAMVANSLCFTLLTPEAQIGFARAVTDYVTFFYLTDVYVLEEWQGEGLGTWMIECVQEFVEGLPHLRRSMLMTGKGGKEKLYEKTMKMSQVGDPSTVMSWKGPGCIW